MKPILSYIKESTKQHILIWLDDIRNPLEKKWQSFIKSAFKSNNIDNIIWLKSYNELKNWIDTNGLPTYISFDHDLGDVSNPDKEKTGYDCCKYIVNYCMDNNCDFPKYAIQSDNGPGKENIDKYIKNFKKHYNK